MNAEGSFPAPERGAAGETPIAAAFRSQLAGWVTRHEAVRARRDMLELFAQLLEATVDRGLTLDSIVRFNGGYNTQFDVGRRVDIVTDSHGPALAMEGGGGELLIVIPFIQRIERETRKDGLGFWLETGEYIWLGSF